MIIVGLTGGIASGKSLVSRCLRELGARIIDADLIARQVVEPDSPILRRIVSEFGDGFLDASGRLERDRLAQVIFADEKERRRLEAIIHPAISESIRNLIAEHAAADPKNVIIVDAALMIEAGMHVNFDKIIVVYADENTRLDRLMARDGLSRHEAYKRLLAQMPLEDKLGYADFVVDNSGGEENTRRQVMRIYNRLLRNADQGAAEEEESG